MNLEMFAPVNSTMATKEFVLRSVTNLSFLPFWKSLEMAFKLSDSI